jgi:hypothetical protein
MLGRHIHVVQPYWVGTKYRKSLAMIIPAGFARDNHIDTSTICILKNENSKMGKIILQRIKDIEDEKSMTPDDVIGIKPQSPQVSLPMETEVNIASTGVDTGRQ